MVFQSILKINNLHNGGITGEAVSGDRKAAARSSKVKQSFIEAINVLLSQLSAEQSQKRQMILDDFFAHTKVSNKKNSSSQT